jgi:hypothetical protein
VRARSTECPKFGQRISRVSKILLAGSTISKISFDEFFPEFPEKPVRPEIRSQSGLWRVYTGAIAFAFLKRSRSSAIFDRLTALILVRFFGAKKVVLLFRHAREVCCGNEI